MAEERREEQGDGGGEEEVEEQRAIVVHSGHGNDDKLVRVVVRIGARFLFYPTLLYNVVRHNVEQEFHWWNQIDQGLILGAVPFRRHVLHLKEMGVTGVVTLNESFETLVGPSFYKRHGIEHCVIATTDYYFAPSVSDIRRAVKFLRDHILRGGMTYVHCKAGRGRSTTVVLCYLIEYRGLDPLQAFEHVRRIRPRVALASRQWEAVWDYTRTYCFDRLAVYSSSVIDDEPVMITELDLAGHEHGQGADKTWILWINLGLVHAAWTKLSCLLRIKELPGGRASLTAEAQVPAIAAC